MTSNYFSLSRPSTITPPPSPGGASARMTSFHTSPYKISPAQNAGHYHFVTPRKMTHHKHRYTQPEATTPVVMSVGGMLQVVAAPAVRSPPSMNTPHAGAPSTSLFKSQLAIREASEREEKHQLLTQKQVRELRRLCRKTANRADFEDRLIQIRQIASIAAMGTPAARMFDPHNRDSGASLRAWVERHREDGADWRDERPLPDDAIEELRRWDRGLKAWARLRFEAAPAASPHSFATAVPSGPPGFPVVSASPATPFTQRQRKVGSSSMHFSSPISPEGPLIPSPIHPLYSPVRPVSPNRFGSAAHGGLEKNLASDTHVRTSATPPAVESRLPLLTTSLNVHPTRSEVSINRVGDTINITVPTGSAADLKIHGEREQLSESVPCMGQENVHPTAAKRQDQLHAANTARSWRNAAALDPRANYTISAENELAFRNAAKTLFTSSAADVAAAVTTTPGAATKRSNMDWGKLRRPALRALDVNSSIGNHIAQRFASQQQ